MVTITPTKDSKGQLSINVGLNRIKLDCSSPKNAIEMSDADYALAKESLAPWVGVKVTVEESHADDTDVLAEVDVGAEKKPVKKKKRGLLGRAKKG